MGSWNYRIIRHPDHVALHEVHYDKDGRVEGWTEDPVRFVGDSPRDLINTLERALKSAREQSALEQVETERNQVDD